MLTGVGDAGRPTYKRSRRGDAEIDRAVEHVLRHSGEPTTSSLDFSPVRLRRAPVLLAGLRPPGRVLHADPVRPLSRVPHLGRRPRASSSPRRSPDSLPQVCLQRSPCSRATRPTSTSTRTASRSSAGAGCTAAPAAARTRALGELALLWVLNLSDCGTRCSTSPSARGSSSGRSGGGRRALAADLLEEVRVRVLVTGSEGYIGSPPRPVPRRARPRRRRRRHGLLPGRAGCTTRTTARPWRR